MRINELFQQGIEELTTVGIPDCRSDVELLLCHCLGKSRTGLYLAAGEHAPEAVRIQFKSLLSRRKEREPLAYILGEQEFWSLPFTVNPAVLIPRPETEFLLETVFSILKDTGMPEGRIMDLCCGSGAIAVVLARELGKNITAVDLSATALSVSRANCRRHGVTELVNLVQSDLLQGVKPERRYSLVVSNPPYVSTGAVLHEVEPEVGLYEPRLALDGGVKGMDIISRIYGEVRKVLMPGGLLFIEIGYDQGRMVYDLFHREVSGQKVFSYVEILKDYAGRDRVLHAVIS